MTPALALLAAIAVATGLALVVLGIAYPAATPPAELIAARLRGYHASPVEAAVEEELRAPFRDRVLRPALDRVGRFAARHAPSLSVDETQRRLSGAGLPLEPGLFIALRGFAATAAGVLGLLAGWVAFGPVPGLLAGAVLAATGWFGPLAAVEVITRRRRDDIARVLPDAIDLVTVCVEAGESLDAAIGTVALRISGPFSDELRVALRETQLGRPRQEALAEMAARTGLDEVNALVQAMTQSEQLGVGVVKMLRAQSTEIRRRRRNRAQEEAQRATLRMIVPMVGCIFPTLWIILLGPGLILVLGALR